MVETTEDRLCPDAAIFYDFAGNPLPGDPLALAGVPEPASWILIAAGAVGLAITSRFRRGQ